MADYRAPAPAPDGGRINVRAGRREWTGLAVLLFPLLLVSMDVSVLYFATPFISAALDPSAAQQLWIVDVYGFVLSGLLITMGVLGDRIGRRCLLLLGAAAFGASSLAAAYSASASMLIAARAVLGLAGATLMPSTLALIRNMFHDPRQRRTAVAVWTAGLSAGIAVGPVISGVLLDHFWWGSVFLINIPVMALLLVLGPVLVPEFRHPAPGRFDLASAVLSLGSVLGVVYGIQQLAQDGPRPVPVAAVVAGVAVAALFVRRQRRRPDPVIDIGLFRNRAFSAAIGINVLAIFGIVGFAFFATQFLELVLALRPLTAALWQLPVTVLVAAVAPAAAKLAGKVRPAFVIGTGLLIAALGFAVVTQVRAHWALGLLLTAAALYATGLVAGMALTADMILTAVPAERAGAASALSETANELGGALGIAVLGSIGAAVYRHDMAGAVPAGLPPAAAHAAGQTLGGATAVARRLPERSGAALLHAAHQAFTAGMHVAAVTNVAVMVAAATAAVVILRHVRAGPLPAEPGAEPDGAPDRRQAAPASGGSGSVAP